MKELHIGCKVRINTTNPNLNIFNNASDTLTSLLHSGNWVVNLDTPAIGIYQIIAHSSVLVLIWYEYDYEIY